MTGVNLPPGCNVSDIPGNRPEDWAIDDAEQAAIDRMAEARLDPDEYELCVTVGLAAVEQSRKHTDLRINNVLVNNQEFLEYIADELDQGGDVSKLLRANRAPEAGHKEE